MSDEEGHKIEYGNLGDPNADPLATYARVPFLRITRAMGVKLRKNANKGYWGALEMSYIFARIEQELMELKVAIVTSDDPEKIWHEAADVANFAMMAADNATFKTLFQRVRYAILAAKYDDTTELHIAQTISASLRTIPIPAAITYRLDDLPDAVVPVMAFNAINPTEGGIVVHPLSAGTLEEWTALFTHYARSMIVSEIVVPTPLNRVNDTLPREVARPNGDTIRVTPVYIGAQIR